VEWDTTIVNAKVSGHARDADESEGGNPCKQKRRGKRTIVGPAVRYEDAVNKLVKDAACHETEASRILHSLSKLNAERSLQMEWEAGVPMDEVKEHELWARVKHVVGYMRKKGLKARTVRTVINEGATIFLAPPSQLMGTLEYLQGMHLRDKELNSSVLKCPRLLHCNADQIRVISSYFKNLELSAPQIFSLLKKEPKLFTGPKAGLVAQVTALKQAGVSAKLLPKVLVQCPRSLAHDAAHYQGHIEFLQSRGLDPNQVRTLVSRAPQVFGYSLDTLQLKFDFLTQEMGLSLPQILRHGKLLLCASLLDKLGPRTAIMATQDRPCYPPTYVRRGDRQFCALVGMAPKSYLKFAQQWASDHQGQWSTGRTSNADLKRKQRRSQAALQANAGVKEGL